MRDWATANAKAKVVLLRYFNPVPLASTHLALPILAAHALCGAPQQCARARAHAQTPTQYNTQYHVSAVQSEASRQSPRMASWYHAVAVAVAIARLSCPA
jgi:hypothetical protein